MSAVNAELDEWQNWNDFPGSWPRKAGASIPIGVTPINADIRKSASRRWQRIKTDLEHAGPHYPREKVSESLVYWKLDLAKFSPNKKQ